MTLPGEAEALQLVAKHVARGAQLLVVDGEPTALATRLAAQGLAVTATRPGPALAAPQTVDALLALHPARWGALIPFLQEARRALVPEGVLVVADLVWQTAPTPELLRAFAPPPGKERVRPIEGWEMQAEHAGFELVERLDAPRVRWAPLLVNAAQRAAVDADERGAAKVAAWALRPG